MALHAGEGSSRRLAGGHHRLVERNTLMLVAKAFPARWLPLVAYRQLAWAWHAQRERRLRAHLAGALAALALLPVAVRERGAVRDAASVPIELVVPSRPIRNRQARVASTQTNRTARAR